MTRAPRPAAGSPRPDVRSRLHGSALALFREHGISGTSLQMIADDLGVTKAAVYYHYRTKEDLVLGVLGPLVEGMRAVVESAEARPDPLSRRRTALDGLADLTVRAREVYGVFAGDPSITHMSALAPDLLDLGRRAKAALAGPDPGPDTRVRVSMLLSGMAGPLRDPLTHDVDDDTLRALVVAAGEHLLRLPPTP